MIKKKKHEHLQLLLCVFNNKGNGCDVRTCNFHAVVFSSSLIHEITRRFIHHRSDAERAADP